MPRSSDSILGIVQALPYQDPRTRKQACDTLQGLSVPRAVLSGSRDDYAVLSVSGDTGGHQLVLPKLLTLQINQRDTRFTVGDLVFRGDAPVGFADRMKATLRRAGWRSATSAEVLAAQEALKHPVREERPGKSTHLVAGDYWVARTGGMFSLGISSDGSAQSSYRLGDATIKCNPLLSLIRPALTNVSRAEIQQALVRNSEVAEMAQELPREETPLSTVLAGVEHQTAYVNLLGTVSNALERLVPFFFTGKVPKPVACVGLGEILRALNVPQMEMKVGKSGGSLGSVRLNAAKRGGTPTVEGIKRLLQSSGAKLPKGSQVSLERIVSGPPVESFYGRCLGTRGSPTTRAGIFSWYSTEPGKDGEWRTVALLTGTKKGPFTYDMLTFKGGKLVGLSLKGQRAVKTLLTSLMGLEDARPPDSVTLTDDATASQLMTLMHESEGRYAFLGGTSNPFGYAIGLGDDREFGETDSTFYHVGRMEIVVQGRGIPEHRALSDHDWGTPFGPRMNGDHGLAVNLRGFHIPPLSRSGIAQLLGYGENNQRESVSSRNWDGRVSNLFEQMKPTDVVRNAEATKAVLDFFRDTFFEPLCDILEQQAQSWRKSGVPEWEISRKIEAIGAVLPWPTISQVTSAIKAKERESRR